MRPLDGLRVVDFGQGVAGPYCAMLLGDFGAGVVKIEPPRGDWSRNMGAKLEGGASATFLSANRNKRSVCLDLADERGREIAAQLIAKADVVVESFRPGVMERMGFGYETLARSRPELIYCSITGFGAGGPYADLPAGDSTMQAIGGLMSIVGDETMPPMRVGNVVSDMLAGMHGFEAVLLSLLNRGTTGRGAHPEISLFGTMLAFQAAPITEFLASGKLPPRVGNAHPLISPSGIVRTADRPIMLTVLDHQWTRFCDLMGFPDLGADARFATNEGRNAHRKELLERISSAFETRAAGDVIAELRANDFLCAPVNTYADIAADPQTIHDDTLIHAESASLGRFPGVRNPIRFSQADAALAAAPACGAHTYEVLKGDLALPDEAIDELLRAKVAYRHDA